MVQSKRPRFENLRRARQHLSETPYANLILAMLKSDPTLLIRGDEAEESWRVIDPVMKAWSAGDVPMQEYAAGTAPPGPSF